MKTFKDNNHIFYVSSRGHNGTTWLSRSLSLHPDIICWHGTRSIPPKGSNKNEESLSPREFANGLAACNSSCQNSKIFGAVHGFYGLDMKIPMEMENGAFLYLLRNPLNTINSNFIFKMKNIFSNITSEDDIRNLMLDIRLNEIEFEFKNDQKKQNKKSFLPKDLLPEVSTNIKLNAEQFLVLKQFMISVGEIVFYDFFNISVAGLDKLIKFEEMVLSPEYFEKNVIKKINPNIECSKDYLEIIFNQGVINQHSGQSYDVKQIREKWLPFQNKIFDFVCFEGIFPISNAYSDAQYRISPFSTEYNITEDLVAIA